MIQLPTGFLNEKNKVRQDGKWMFLWELEADRTTVARTVMRVVAHDQPVTYLGMTFYPWPMEQSEIEQDGDGNLPVMTLALDNTTGLLSYYLETGRGFQGNRANCWLVNSKHLSGGTSGHLFGSFLVSEAQLAFGDTFAVLFKMEIARFSDRMSPQDRFNASRCRFVFGGGVTGECPYVLNAVAAYQVCAKHIQDCILRGADMRLRGLADLLPTSFGGFLGISARR